MAMEDKPAISGNINGNDAATVPSKDELVRFCGRTIAFILAPNAQAKGALAPAVRDAVAAKVPAVFVMADMTCADEAVEAVRTVHRKGGTLVQAAEFDFSTAYGNSTDEVGFHLEELPLNMVQILRALAASTLDVYEAILIIDASQGAPSPAQIYGLCARLHGGIDSGQVYAEQDADPSAYVLSREALEALEGDE